MYIRYKHIVPIIFVIVCASLVVIKLDNTNLARELPYDCYIYRKYGIYCAGCGGTRAVMEFLNGNIFASIKYHPAVVYSAGVMIYMMFEYIRSIVKKTELVISPVPFYLLIGVIILQWIFKDYMLIFCGRKII